MSLHSFHLQKFKENPLEKQHNAWLKKNLFKKTNYNTLAHCFKFAEKLYERGHYSMDLFRFIHQIKEIPETKKYLYLLYFDEIRKEFRNEKLLIFYILYFIFMRPGYNLENIEIM
jgi:hypothetical protein